MLCSPRRAPSLKGESQRSTRDARSARNRWSADRQTHHTLSGRENLPKFKDITGNTWSGVGAEPHTVRAICVADADGDGKQEVFLAGSSQSVFLDKPQYPLSVKGQMGWGGYLRVCRYNKEQLTQLAIESWSGMDIADARAVCAADVDGDGKIEIITAGSSTFIGHAPDSEYQANYTTRPYLRIYNWDGKKLKLKSELTVLPHLFPNQARHRLAEL